MESEWKLFYHSLAYSALSYNLIWEWELVMDKLICDLALTRGKCMQLSNVQKLCLLDLFLGSALLKNQNSDTLSAPSSSDEALKLFLPLARSAMH